ncbi:MAG: isochorismatase family cysteine hydrolase [Methanomassiliicoccus sp.]|nr:isochorismatase family cysteine hydrolase [Methanomassiliicoccus sp.]
MNKADEKRRMMGTTDALQWVGIGMPLLYRPKRGWHLPFPLSVSVRSAEGEYLKPALLVIDVQNGWMEISRGLRASVDVHMDAMNEAISIFRRCGAPIILSYHSYEEKGMVTGSSAFEYLSEIKTEKNDIVIVKRYMNAFNKTELEAILRDRGCDTLMIVGLSALHCVLSTYMGAYDRDILPYLVRNGVAGPDEDSVSIAERICDTLSLRAIAQILDD